MAQSVENICAQVRQKPVSWRRQQTPKTVQVERAVLEFLCQLKKDTEEIMSHDKLFYSCAKEQQSFISLKWTLNFCVKA